jgi:hypothetical protein
MQHNIGIINKSKYSRLKKFIESKLLLLILVISSIGYAQNPTEGEWMIVLNGKKAQIDNSITIGAPSDNKAPIMGILSLKKVNGNWLGHVEGGPVPVTINDSLIEIIIDSRDLAGFSFNRRLTGTFLNSEITGTFTIEGATELPEPGGNWIATRVFPEKTGLPPTPKDMSGIWTPAPGMDFRKYSMDLTDKAKSWHKDYLDHYDQPNVRCVSPGIVAMVAWGAYPFEILESENRYSFLYEVDSEVRRIFMNDRLPPEYYPNSSMGFSNGRWDGNNLIIDTQLLEGNVRDFRGEPISEGARMNERYTLSEDGNSLYGVITLLDPDNYKKPPVRRRKWVRNPDTVIYPYECDPDSFYRQMYNEDKIDMYFDRAQRRQID